MSKITLTYPDGSKKEFEKGVTGMYVAESIGKRLASDALSIKVDDRVQSLTLPIEANSKIKILTWTDKEGKETFWHSTAHVLAHAISRLYPNAKNTIGPPVEDGFFYDFDDLKITPEDFPKIEAEMKKIVEANFPIEKHDWTLADIKKHQGNNPYKLQLAQEFTERGWKLTAYKQGEFIDLCEGPHVPSTGVIKAFKLIKLAAAYWKGDQKNKQLTRVYGIGFPSQKDLTAWTTLQEEVAKRDHRKIGKELGLFMFHEWSPGSPFLLPRGTVLFNELQNFVRAEYVKRGYTEVITPQLYNKALWETSGHWQHYRDNMFTMTIDGEDFSLKPMNCPSHCLIYREHAHSYRDLPLRIADFCFLHRNEVRGALGGMTRVRKFSQDDAHIFCRVDQIQDEIHQLLDFVRFIYTDTFKMEVSASLSTKPQDSLGDAQTWQMAETALSEALNKQKIKFTVKAGEGAFYGPKIDFEVKDALGRLWQLATIQLDFQMPQRFKLEYADKDNTLKTPVMIHRAILGSLERFMGVLVEHYAGKFPVWLAPVQARILPLSDKFNGYAGEVGLHLRNHNIRIEVDTSVETLNKKVRNAQLDQIPYILVVGEKEMAAKSVAVRTRDGKVHGEVATGKFIDALLREIAEKK
jgi:threonyl-tRNA synthetase